MLRELVPGTGPSTNKKCKPLAHAKPGTSCMPVQVKRLCSYIQATSFNMTSKEAESQHPPDRQWMTGLSRFGRENLLSCEHPVPCKQTCCHEYGEPDVE